MLLKCLTRKKNKHNKTKQAKGRNPIITKTNKGQVIILSKYGLCNT